MKTEEHVINLTAGGRLSASGAAVSSQAQIAGILRAFAASGKPSLTLYFHGRLVSERAGLHLADHLYTELAENGQSYPVFVVWESGVVETLQGSLLEIVQSSPIFHKVLQKLLKHVARKLPVVGDLLDLELAPAPEAASAQAASAIVRADLEAERLPAADPALLNAIEPASPDAVADVDDADIAALQDDLAGDHEARRALENILRAAAPAPPAGDLEMAEKPDLPSPATTGYLSTELLRELQATQPPAGVEAEFALAATAWAFAGRILRAVIGRYRAGTDHGLVATVLEEMYRAMYADKVGRFIWDAMKASARLAYADNVQGMDADKLHGMSLFLDLLKQHSEQEGAVTLNLIGHSAGAIHICHFIERAARMLDDDFAINLLALTTPACTCDLFLRTVTPHLDHVKTLRVFALHDELEKRDPLLKWLSLAYPHSLLYLVSGLLEEQTDAALLGMARYTTGARQEDNDAGAVRRLLQQYAGSLVFAQTGADAPPDQRAAFSSHYGATGPAYDRATLESIAAIIRPAPLTDLRPLETTLPDEKMPLLQPDKDVILQRTGDNGGVHSVDDLLAAQLGGSPAAPRTTRADESAGEVDELDALESLAALEAIIGESDLIDHALVKGLLHVGRAVARVVVSGVEGLDTVAPTARATAWQQAVADNALIQGYGTGWIFGRARRLLMTNNHVLPLPEAARSAMAEFGYERDLRSGARPQSVLALDPDAFFLTSPNLRFDGLDYTLVAFVRQPGEELGYLEPVQGVTASNASNIYIVQHPRGDPKAYILNHNRKVNLTDRYVTYISDTLSGSSGSPLFNDALRLVGIHHVGNYIVTIGTRSEQTNLGSRIEVIISDIVQQLQAQGLSEEQVAHWFGEGPVLTHWRAATS